MRIIMKAKMLNLIYDKCRSQGFLLANQSFKFSYEMHRSSNLEEGCFYFYKIDRFSRKLIVLTDTRNGLIENGFDARSCL